MIVSCLILYIFQLSCYSADSDNEPIKLSNASVTATDRNKVAYKLNDGDKDSCFYIHNPETEWIFFDVKTMFRLRKMILWNKYYYYKQNISVYVGKEFTPCIFEKQLGNFRPCKRNVHQTEKKIEFECDTTRTFGQFIAIVISHFSSSEKTSYFNLCEVEAYGTSYPTIPTTTRPEIKDKPNTSVLKDTFEIIKEIRNDVPSVTIPKKSTGLIYMNNKCEPIIWDFETKLPFSVACKTDDGKGRIVLFGKNEFFVEYIKKESMSKFRNNLYKWLSPQSENPNIVSTEYMHTINDLKTKIKPGDIIDFNVWDPVPKDVLEEIKAMLLNGSTSIIFHHTFWVDTTIEARNSYLEILNIFNVDFISQLINYGSVKTLNFTLTDINEDFLSTERKLEKLAKSHDYFLKSGKEISSKLLTYPTSMLAKTKAREYLLQIVTKYNDLLTWICPCKGNPTMDQTNRIIVETFQNLISNQLLVNSGYKLPCIEFFPGDFTSRPETSNVTVTIESPYTYALNPVGYYLEAGATLQYEISKAKGLWFMSIGCHTDDSAKISEWIRYPNIYVEKVPLSDSGSVYSPFGGVVWLYNDDANSTITISLSNVVSTPYFNARDTSSISNWDSQKSNPGLWAIIAGNKMMICVESTLIRSFTSEFLHNLMTNIWDVVVKMDFALKSLDWKDKRPEIAVLDIMPSLGTGHSGYPFVGSLNWFISFFNWTEIHTNGCWGVFHEIGHNMQESEWTFAGTGEVTNNLFMLFNFDKLLKLPYYGSTSRKYIWNSDEASSVKEFLDKGASFEEWKSSPSLALLVYAQIANHFGWGFYNQVFAHYKDTKMELNNDNDKMAMWINVTSTIAEQNLIPMFDFWGFPIEKRVEESLNHLPCFFPDDFNTKLSEIRTKYIESKYKSCAREAKFYKDFSIDNLKTEIRFN